MIMSPPPIECDTSGSGPTRRSSHKSSSVRHSGVSPNHSNSQGSSSNDEGLSFPLKLHAMLDDAETKDFSHIVSWQPGNKSFRVHDVNAFGGEVMPQYFNQTKFKSFQRQLNIYGYRRIQHGPLKGGYVHKCFIRGRPELSSGVTRRSNNKAAAASAVAAKVMEMVKVVKTPAHRPDILQVAPNADPTQLEEVFQEVDYEPIKNLAQSVDFGSCNLQGVLERIFHNGDNPTVSAAPPEEEMTMKQPAKGHHGHRNPPVSPRHYARRDNAEAAAGHFRSASGFVFNLTQEDATEGEDADMNALFDMLAGGATGQDEDDEDEEEEDDDDDAGRGDLNHASSTSDEDEQESEEQLSERIFPLKLHKMLEHAKRDSIEHIVSWVNDGTGFKVHNSQLFTQQVMPMWFDQTKYESFRRQLNLYSFSRVSRGPQRGVYSHPSFISGRRDLLGNVVRKINGQEGIPKKQKGSASVPTYGQYRQEPVPSISMSSGFQSV